MTKIYYTLYGVDKDIDVEIQEGIIKMDYQLVIFAALQTAHFQEFVNLPLPGKNLTAQLADHGIILTQEWAHNFEAGRTIKR
ncbi:hypothetical protein JFK97_05740 [Chromobacterium phragmitis]|uniref:hypothetical protein n=1 Tax=Chromobacterium amazonense TaxID=1382803 RepID=UPI0021B77D44|nr:hypothetical protein [Chromobacterium amazonense]MBM2883886.1 hypothetical protein [Chromobacterium amazonense]MDE1711803.1 hypothetical protein [Chromobacterium amazonense]